MTLGDGILWSTVIVVLAASIYQISIRNRWRTVGKAFGILVLAGILIGGALWGEYIYKSRPRPYAVTELGGVRLGMTPLEVRVAKGAPINKGNATLDLQEDSRFRMTWAFDIVPIEELKGLPLLTVIFDARTQNDLKVSIVCERDGYRSLLGLSSGDTEEDMVEKVGLSTNESISEDGLSKLVSFKQWKVAYEVAKGQIGHVCVSESGKVAFADEWIESADEWVEAGEELGGEAPGTEKQIRAFAARMLAAGKSEEYIIDVLQRLVPLTEP